MSPPLTGGRLLTVTNALEGPVHRIHSYLPVIVSTVLFTGLGVVIGLLWWAGTGRTDMPWWLAVVLVAVASWISDLAEQALRHRRFRRTRPGLARHRKQAV